MQLRLFARLAVAESTKAPPPPEPGILTWYKQQTGMVAPPARGPSLMRVPAVWCTTFYGRSGARLDLSPGQVVSVHADDVVALTKLGCVMVPI